MSLARRLQLLEWSHRNGAWIIEDDYDSEFRFEGRPIASLASLDPDGRVIYLGTLSKVLAPALRLGYMVVPESLLEAFVAARYALDRHGPNLEQAIAARFLDEGHFLRHLRRTRILYGQRQRALLSALHEYRDVLDAAPAPAGLHLLARLGGGWSEESAAAAARAQGISVHPLARYGAEWPQPPALVLGFAPFAEVAIARAAEQLGTALRKRT
jgi:GntR family transcriptional regulator/MocR family aminotransferase